MLNRRQVILIGCAGLAVTVSAVSFSTSRDDDGHLLVKQLFEIAGPPDVPEKTSKSKAREDPPVRSAAAPAIDGLPSETEKVESLDSIMKKPLPSGLAEPFYGTWGERSITDDAMTTLTTTLHRDGRFTLHAVQKPRDGTGRTLRIETRGRWTMDGNDVVLVVDSTDTPGVIPSGFVQVHAGSKVRADEWTYEDSDGQARIARRQ